MNVDMLYYPKLIYLKTKTTLMFYNKSYINKFLEDLKKVHSFFLQFIKLAKGYAYTWIFSTDDGYCINGVHFITQTMDYTN